MVKNIVVNSYAEFYEAVKSVDSKNLVLCCFTGSNDASGKSWCPDCVAAKPAIQAALEKAPENTVLITCLIDRSLWIEKTNPFRTDATLKLTCVPTLLRWGTVRDLLHR